VTAPPTHDRGAAQPPSAAGASGAAASVDDTADAQATVQATRRHEASRGAMGWAESSATDAGLVDAPGAVGIPIRCVDGGESRDD
jgi:hypothetical protein